MIKIIILNPTLPAYRKDFFGNLNNRLKERDIHLTIFYGSKFLNKKVKKISNPKFANISFEPIQFDFMGFHLIWWKSLMKSFRKVKPDLLIINSIPGNLSHMIIQWIAYVKKIRVGIWGCGYVRDEVKGVKKQVRNIIHNYFLFHADFHICYSTKYKKELLGIGINNSKIFVAQNTINIENILAKNYVKKLTDGPVKFLFVGALIREKNLDLAIRALGQLVREGYDIRFEIIGQGEIIGELESLVKEEKMKDYIHILGPKYGEELSSCFLNADVFLLPGAGGLAVNEAMAYGLPLISTEGDGTIPDLLYEGDNGYLIREKVTIDSILEACKKILVYDKKQLMLMGLRSKEIVREKATLRNMLDQFEKAISYGLRSD